MAILTELIEEKGLTHTRTVAYEDPVQIAGGMKMNAFQNLRRANTLSFEMYALSVTSLKFILK